MFIALDRMRRREQCRMRGYSPCKREQDLQLLEDQTKVEISARVAANDHVNLATAVMPAGTASGLARRTVRHSVQHAILSRQL